MYCRISERSKLNQCAGECLWSRYSAVSNLRSITTKLDSILESGATAREATSQFSADLELQMGKIWQRLDSQLESLGKQLAEKAEENGMVSTLYKRKEAECAKHEQELVALKEATEKQAEQIHDLEANLVAMDAAQDDNEETIRRLEATGTEAVRLKEELRSKTAAVAELESKLNAKDRTHASEVQKYSSNMLQLAQSIQEKDQSSRISAHQAAENARREVRIEMERASTEAEHLLRDTQRERDSLAGQLETLKQKVLEKEQIEDRDSSIIKSLREDLIKAEDKGKCLTQELAQCPDTLKQLENRLTSRVEMLEVELEVSKKRATEMEEESHRQRAKSQALITALTHWATQTGLDIDGLGYLDGNASVEDISAGVVRTLEQLSVSQKPLTASHEHRPEELLLPDAELNSVSGGIGHLSHPNQENQDQAAGDQAEDDFLKEFDEYLAMCGDSEDDVSERNVHLSRLQHLRRVVVRSPANVPNEPLPPSVDQEKVRRRGALQPKSIMKRVTRSTSVMLKQGEAGASAGHGAFRRSTQDETPIDPLAPTRSRGKLSSTGSVQSSDAEGHESTNREASSRPNKRKRSNTPRSNISTSRAGSSKQAKTTEPNAPSTVTRTEEPTGSHHNHDAPATGQPTHLRRRRQERPSTVGGSNSTPVAAHKPHGTPRVASRNFRRSLSENTAQAPGPRQPNLRTYGSRAVRDSSTAGGNADFQFSLRSQPQSQSQYWPKSRESQDSVAFSQGGIKTEEDFLLPFSNLRS